MPESRSVSVPHGLSSVVDIVRRENRLNTYREYHKSVQAHSAVELASLHDQCQLQTERLRERLVTTKSKKKRPNTGGGSGGSAGDQRKDGTPLSQPAQSPVSENVAMKRPLESADRVAPTKQPKRDPDSDLRSRPPPAYSCSQQTVSVSATSRLSPASVPSSSLPSVPPSTSCLLSVSASTSSLPCVPALPSSVPSSSSLPASSCLPATSGLIDDLFGEVSGDIDYEHVLQQLTAGDPSVPAGSSGSSGHSAPEIPDIGDLSCWIEGAERGVDVGFPAAAPAATMLRNMADRLSSGSAGAPPAPALSPAPVKQEQHPGVCDAAMISAELPKLTMEQRLRLKRQMMAEEFRQAHLKQQSEQSMSSPLMQQQQQQSPSSSLIHQQSPASMVHLQTSAPCMVPQQSSGLSMIHQQTPASSMVHQHTGLHMVHQQQPDSLMQSAVPNSQMYGHQQLMIRQQQQRLMLQHQQQQMQQQQRAAVMAGQGGMVNYSMIPPSAVRHPQRFMVPAGDARLLMMNQSSVGMEQSFPPVPLQQQHPASIPRHVAPQPSLFANQANAPVNSAPIGSGMAPTVPTYCPVSHPYR